MNRMRSFKIKNSLVALFVLSLMFSCGGMDDLSQLETLRIEKDSLKKVKSEVAKLLKEVEIDIKRLDTTKNNRIPLVTTEIVSESHFKHFFEVQGVIETDRNAAINSEVSAKIVSIHVKEGQYVKKGQILVKLDSKVIRNNIAEIKNQVELAQIVYDKQKSLWDQNIGSEIQYLEAKNNLESLKRRRETMYSQLEMYHIDAPFSGTVDEIYPKIGEMAYPLGPAIRIVNLDEVYIKADVSERYLGKIKAGDSALISFPSLNIEKVSSISRLGNFINPNNRTFKVRFDMQNDIDELKPNLLAKIKIMDYDHKNAVVVPTKFIQENPNGDEFVYLLSKNSASMAKKQMVKTGMSYQGQIEITEGLAAGDEIILQGAKSIKDGEIVEVTKK